jgi:hypothetical protein
VEILNESFPVEFKRVGYIVTDITNTVHCRLE